MLPTKAADGVLTLVDNRAAAFTSKELIGLYHECGKMLHRGTLSTLGQTDISKQRFVSAGQWAQKIKGLATSHAIAGYGRDGLFLWWVMVDDDLKPSIVQLERLAAESSDKRTGTATAK